LSTSIVIESKDLPERESAQKRRDIITPKLPSKDKKYEAVKRRIFRQFSEVIESSLLVFACLAVYKITGLHAWWLHLVNRILSMP
jgi:hypothetical protein